MIVVATHFGRKEIGIEVLSRDIIMKIKKLIAKRLHYCWNTLFVYTATVPHSMAALTRLKAF